MVLHACTGISPYEYNCTLMHVAFLYKNFILLLHIDSTVSDGCEVDIAPLQIYRPSNLYVTFHDVKHQDFFWKLKLRKHCIVKFRTIFLFHKMTLCPPPPNTCYTDCHPIARSCGTDYNAFRLPLIAFGFSCLHLRTSLISV